MAEPPEQGDQDIVMRQLRLKHRRPQTTAAQRNSELNSAERKKARREESQPDEPDAPSVPFTYEEAPSGAILMLFLLSLSVFYLFIRLFSLLCVAHKRKRGSMRSVQVFLRRNQMSQRPKLMLDTGTRSA